MAAKPRGEVADAVLGDPFPWRTAAITPARLAALGTLPLEVEGTRR
jgi:hypothetical protein